MLRINPQESMPQNLKFLWIHPRGECEMVEY
jgi:hypothetical protein